MGIMLEDCGIDFDAVNYDHYLYDNFNIIYNYSSIGFIKIRKDCDNIWNSKFCCLYNVDKDVIVLEYCGYGFGIFDSSIIMKPDSEILNIISNKVPKYLLVVRDYLNLLYL